MLEALAASTDSRLRAIGLSTQLVTARLRGHREILNLGMPGAVPTGRKRRTIYDAKEGSSLPGTLVRSEGQADGADTTVNEAYEYSGVTYDFYHDVLERNSVDDRGMRLDSSVHYREDPSEEYDNAYWDGRQMVYGDGDGVCFDRFTKCVDVIGHELTHGVTQFEANLEYHSQAGALNESISDVFGTLVKQWHFGQTVDNADWLIGAGLFMPSVRGKALRSMKEPGTAYDDPRLGRDPQPGHMKDLVHLPDSARGDWGGVHINSGIPNRAFYLSASALGGHAWEKAGKIWYQALCARLRPHSAFKKAADATISVAQELFGTAERAAVQAGWKQVGVLG
ncbi:MAG: M4 family metallopeptidase [Spirochaetia bacterium]|jgi:Zn-dependent metalloprotease